MRRAKSAWLRQKIYFDVSERVLMHGCSSDGRVVAITAIQSISGQGFSDAGIDGLTEMAGVLVPILAKHIEYCEYRHSAGRALSSLEEIERCISKTRRLTLRETEVCARTVYGMSTAGIAHALGIGEESVKTYRRRAYEKVGVGSSREIVGWYLARWSEAIH
jgi:DNA-binding CsgD family transcriptional regulator